MQAFYDNNTKYTNIFYILVAFQSRLNNCFQKTALLIAIQLFLQSLMRFRLRSDAILRILHSLCDFFECAESGVHVAHSAVRVLVRNSVRF